MIRYGVAGSGYFGAGLSRIINSFEDAKVTAILGRRNSEMLAAELSCDIVPTMPELAAREDVDAIIVATPNGFHFEPVTLAAANKKHVFCEKPLALSTADCSAMIKACKENNVVFMAGHIMHFMNGIREVKRVIKSGEIGKVLMCNSERTGWEEPQGKVSWKKIKDISGGHIFHHIHELDFIQSIIGPAKNVYCAGGNLAHTGEDCGDEDDVLLLILECQDNTFSTMEYGTAFRKGEHFIKISGTEGYILIDMRNVEITISSPVGVRKILLHNSLEEDKERAALNLASDGGIAYGRDNAKLPGWLEHEMRKEMQYFHNVVKGGKIDEEFDMLFDGSAARSAVAAAENAMRSLELKNRVDILQPGFEGLEESDV
jgi:predicted dehydrogenase